MTRPRSKTLVTKPEPEPRMSDSQSGGLSGTFKSNVEDHNDCLDNIFPFLYNLLKQTIKKFGFATS